MTSSLTSPLAYVLIHHQQSCTSCGTTSQHSELFIKRHLTPRCGHGKPIIHLTPTQEAPFSLPIEIIQNANKNFPFCSICASGDQYWVAPDHPRHNHAPYSIVGLSYDNPDPEPTKAKPSTSTIKTLIDVLTFLE